MSQPPYDPDPGSAFTASLLRERHRQVNERYFPQGRYDQLEPCPHCGLVNPEWREYCAVEMRSIARCVMR
jgi:hypothetical protein